MPKGFECRLASLVAEILSKPIEVRFLFLIYPTFIKSVNKNGMDVWDVQGRGHGSAVA